jgi:hypothetical protein
MSILKEVNISLACRQSRSGFIWQETTVDITLYLSTSLPAAAIWNYYSSVSLPSNTHPYLPTYLLYCCHVLLALFGQAEAQAPPMSTSSPDIIIIDQTPTYN